MCVYVCVLYVQGSVLTADQSDGVEAQVIVEVTTNDVNVATTINQTITSDTNGKFNFTIPGDVLLRRRNNTLSIQVKLLDDVSLR